MPGLLEAVFAPQFQLPRLTLSAFIAEIEDLCLSMQLRPPHLETHHSEANTKDSVDRAIGERLERAYTA